MNGYWDFKGAARVREPFGSWLEYDVVEPGFATDSAPRPCQFFVRLDFRAQHLRMTCKNLEWELFCFLSNLGEKQDTWVDP